MMTKGGGGVKNLKKLMTSFMNGPILNYQFAMTYPVEYKAAERFLV